MIISWASAPHSHTQGSEPFGHEWLYVHSSQASATDRTKLFLEATRCNGACITHLSELNSVSYRCPSASRWYAIEKKWSTEQDPREEARCKYSLK